MKKRTLIYDEEHYPNFSSFAFKDIKTKEKFFYYIYKSPSGREVNQIKDLIYFVRTQVDWLVGYNNKEYDDPILVSMMLHQDVFLSSEARVITEHCYNTGQEIINSQNDGKTPPIVFTCQHHSFFKSLDLILQFNRIDRVSLKQLAIGMRWPLIQDLPIPHGSIIQDSDLETLINYNWNDVDITEHILFHGVGGQVNNRILISKKYNLDVVNACDTDMAKIIIGDAYSKQTGIPYKDFANERTYYKVLALKECVSPKVKFENREFLKLLDKFNKTKINPVEEAVKEEKDAFKHIIKSRYLEHKIGLGGIHSINPPETIEENERYIYEDLDVRSYYPILIVNENYYPKHLGPVFTTVYKRDIVVPRFKAVDEGDTLLAYMLKITANATFGLCDSEYSWLYDPKVAKSITINGQLYLIMLMEWLEKYTKCAIVYSNTDGLTVRIPRKEYLLYRRICDYWQKLLGFKLEFNQYRKMIVRDVNNYLIFTYDTEKNVKRKGAYEYKKAIQKGYNYPIIPYAVEQYFAKGIDIKDTLMKSKDPYMFMKSERTSDKKFDVKLVTPVGMINEETKLQKNNRWVVTKGNPKEGRLVKQSLITDDITNMQLDRKVTIVNDMVVKDIADLSIDYDFYWQKAMELVNTTKRKSPDTHIGKKIVQTSLNLSL